MARNNHIGSDFDDFLREEGRLDEATAVAVERVNRLADRSGDEGSEHDEGGREDTRKTPS